VLQHGARYQRVLFGGQAVSAIADRLNFSDSAVALLIALPVAGIIVTPIKAVGLASIYFELCETSTLKTTDLQAQEVIAATFD
jgi:hypothetical protein